MKKLWKAKVVTEMYVVMPYICFKVHSLIEVSGLLNYSIQGSKLCYCLYITQFVPGQCILVSGFPALFQILCYLYFKKYFY